MRVDVWSPDVQARPGLVSSSVRKTGNRAGFPGQWGSPDRGQRDRLGSVEPREGAGSPQPEFSGTQGWKVQLVSGVQARVPALPPLKVAPSP